MHGGLVPHQVDSVSQWLERTARAHDETDLKRGARRTRVTSGEGGHLGRRGGRHEQRTELSGIRPILEIQVLANGHVHGSKPRREHGRVVDEVLEDPRMVGESGRP